VVRRQITVQAPTEHAFSVFTERFGDFKPAEHNLLATPIAETVFEPREGGHIYDRGIDGSVCRWARVLVYEPPQRVVFGTRPHLADRKASRTTAASSRFGSQPKHPIAPGWSWNTAT
jgi:hypothetical protein